MEQTMSVFEKNIIFIMNLCCKDEAERLSFDELIKLATFLKSNHQKKLWEMNQSMKSSPHM